MFDGKVNIYCLCAAMFGGIIVHNDDEIILNVNHALVTMTDYEVKDQIGKNNFEVIPSQELIRKNILDNYEKRYEIVVVKKISSTLTVQLQGRVIPRSNKCECWQ